MTKKEWVLKAFNNEEVDRVPMGFWFHFLEKEDQADYFETPYKFELSIAGHKKYIDEFKPDFLKIMSDGFFQYPLEGGKRRVECLADLELIKPIPKDHPWITKQIELVNAIAGYCPDMVHLYNVFSPAQALKMKTLGYGPEVIDLLEEDAEAVAAALDRMADGISTMVTEVLKATGIEGIYMSVGTPNEARCSDEMYRKYITPSDKKVLAAANAITENSMLHICGWGGNRNNLRLFTDYEAKVFNWATHVENIGLSEGKEIFKGHAVLGGFPSETGSFLYKGKDKDEIQAFTRELIEKSGKKGIMVGADCTLPMDISFERMNWVREVLIDMAK